MSDKATYYLILERQVGKREDGKYYLFKDGKWEVDTENAIKDRLVGYDPSEPIDSPYRFGNGSVKPIDSPYRFGNGSVMDEIEKIPYQRALELTEGVE